MDVGAGVGVLVGVMVTVGVGVNLGTCKMLLQSFPQNCPNTKIV